MHGSPPLHHIAFGFLPSATKLRRLCFYKHLSVQGGCLLRGGLVQGGGGVPVPRGAGLGQGVPASGGRGMPGPGGVCSQGVSGPGGLVSQHALRQIPPLAEMATAADGTHPTGMHSYFQFQHSGVMIFLHLNIYAWVTPPHHFILASISTFRCGDLFCT